MISKGKLKNLKNRMEGNRLIVLYANGVVEVERAGQSLFFGTVHERNVSQFYGHQKAVSKAARKEASSRVFEMQYGPRRMGFV